MKVVTFGEIMARLTPPGYQRIRQARGFDLCFAGGEANVAVSAANYGCDAFFVSKVPANDIGDSVIRFLKENSVQTAYVVRGGSRLGIFYLEHGASVRPSKVVYDRAHSAIAEASHTDFNFKKIFKGAQWFHVSGITPALSPRCAALTAAALKIAKQLGVTTSFDLNYRKALWTPEEAQSVCIPLMEHVDVCIGNEEDAEKVLGCVTKGVNAQSGVLNIEAYQKSCAALYKRFNFSMVATTLRESVSASDNGWSALLFDGTLWYRSKKYKLHIVDRVGGGDSFSGGLIYALLAHKPVQKALDFAVAASALKQTLHGDVNQVTREEVEKLAGGDTSGRIAR